MTTRKFTVNPADSSSPKNEIPDHILKRLGVSSGDEIEWSLSEDGVVTLCKAKEPEKQLLLVESICSFRMRYLVEVEARDMESAGRAMSAIRNSDVDDFSQEFTTNNIINVQPVSLNEAKSLVARFNYAVDDVVDAVIDVNIDHFIYRTPSE